MGDCSTIHLSQHVWKRQALEGSSVLTPSNRRAAGNGLHLPTDGQKAPADQLLRPPACPMLGLSTVTPQLSPVP